jgi:hypothetical protein
MLPQRYKSKGVKRKKKDKKNGTYITFEESY